MEKCQKPLKLEVDRPKSEGKNWNWPEFWISFFDNSMDFVRDGGYEGSVQGRLESTTLWPLYSTL